MMDVKITFQLKRTRLATSLCGLVYIVGSVAGFSPETLDEAVKRLASRIIKLEEIE